MSPTLNNLAQLIEREVRAGRAPRSRLTEARTLGEQCLAIRRTLDASAQIWNTLETLANIAEQEGDTDAIRRYRREARETFAAFPGNRFHIDKRFHEFLPVLAAAAEQEELRPALEPLFVELEAANWRVTAPIRRLWAGERDWHALTEGIDPVDALLILRVLETLTGTSPPGEP